MNAGYRVAPQCVTHRLRLVPFDAFYRRQHAFVGLLVRGLGGIETIYRLAVHEDSAQLHGSGSFRGGEGDTVDVRSADTRLHFDLRDTFGVRRGDGHLLSRRLVHRDRRTTTGSQFYFVVQRLAVKTC